jgi:hypothetical protein
LELTDVSEVLTPPINWVIISLMTETARISETSVYFNATTWRYIPEGSNLL